MHITYDKVADAACISFINEIRDGEAVSQVPLVNTPNGTTQVTIDADKDGYLLGFEIVCASRGLRAELLDAAEQL